MNKNTKTEFTLPGAIYTRVDGMKLPARARAALVGGKLRRKGRGHTFHGKATQLQLEALQRVLSIDCAKGFINVTPAAIRKAAEGLLPATAVVTN